MQEIKILKKERYTEVRQCQTGDAEGTQNFKISAAISTPNRDVLPHARRHRNDSL